MTHTRVDYERYRVKPDQEVALAEFRTSDDQGIDKDAGKKHFHNNIRKLKGYQERLFAECRQSLLIVLQAMDTGGKDGIINHVLAAMNPQGCRVAHFRRPSAEEASHDFLWRAHRVAPARSEVVIFNRSHYEDVLIVRVHGLVPREVWSERYQRINEFERTIADSGTEILKFYLHISSEEQLSRFKGRLDDPTKHWKISEADYAERKLWPQYMTAYEEALSRCSTAHAPWFVIPSNHKWFRNLAVARIVVEHLEGLGLAYPKSTVDLARIRREYHAAAQK